MKLQTTVLALTCAVAALSASGAAAEQVVPNPTAPDIRQTDPRAAGPAPTVATLQGNTLFDWGDWGIGVASGIGLTLLTLGGISIIVRRRTGRAPVGPAARVGP